MYIVLGQIKCAKKPFNFTKVALYRPEIVTVCPEITSEITTSYN